MAAGFPEHLIKYYKNPHLQLMNMPDKVMKNVFKHLTPVDCYNFALCSSKTRELVKKRANYTATQIFLRFDDEKSCVAVYFDKFKNMACVFYSWKKADGNRRCWNSAYNLRLSKFVTYIFNTRYHPREVKVTQKTVPGVTINYIQGAVDVFREISNLFSLDGAYINVGVNVSDKKTCQVFCNTRLPPMKINCFRMLGKKEADEMRVKEVLRAIKAVYSPPSIRVSYAIGEPCMNWDLINTSHIILDDPEWLTRIHLLSFNCITADIGHNWLSADDLNAFLFQWLYADSNQTRLQRMEINLSPEAFDNKKKITDGLPLIPWDPKRREGEHFDVNHYLRKASLRDPHHWMDCKYAKDIVKSDGRLATILYYGRKLYFIVWTNHFPYRTLKEARRVKKEEKNKKELLKKLTEALARLNAKAEEEWIQRAEKVAEAVMARQSAARAAAEERVAKRKYIEALKEFMDTSAPKPKRRLLRTITIFKEGEDFKF